MSLTATFNSIGVELRFSGDDNANASAGLEFKKSADSTWRAALPLWRTDDGSTSPGRAFYGSALLLDPGTRYDVRVTLTDPDGVAGTAGLTDSVTTRAEDIPAASALVPTYFVDSGGNDAATGAAPTAAWRTLDKVFTEAPPGAVVQIAPGFYAAPKANSIRTTSLRVIAQNPAVADSRQVIRGESRTVLAEVNPGVHSVVEPRGTDGDPSVSAPTGAQDTDLLGAKLSRVGVWQAVSFHGVSDPTQTYSVWKWAASPAPKAVQLGYATGRDAQPLRVAGWRYDSPGIDTPDAWAEQVFTNPDWHSGFFVSQADGRPFVENNEPVATNNVDIYLRLPDDLNPNDYYVTVAGGGSEAGMVLNGPDIQISGLDFHMHSEGINLRTEARRAVIDHCLFTVGNTGVFVSGTKGAKGAPSAYGSDHVVEHNLFRDSSTWTNDPDGHPAIPWWFVKHPVHLAQYSETQGVGGTGGALRMVIRYNTFDGTFDGVQGYHLGFDRYSMQDADVYGNFFTHHADDSLDLAYGTINYRIWDNRFEQTTTVLSIADPTYGPLYFFRNEAWRTTNAHTGRMADGKEVPSTFFKYGGGSQPQAHVFILHNTLWTDQQGWSPTYGGAKWGEGVRNPEAMYLRNNIIRATGKAFIVPEARQGWDEDYDDFSTDLPNPVGLLGQVGNNIQAYRTKTNQAAHTNLRGDVGEVSDAELVDPGSGDLRLKAGSAFVDRGAMVPNLSDRPGVDFAGTAPDLGAVEQR